MRYRTYACAAQPGRRGATGAILPVRIWLGGGQMRRAEGDDMKEHTIVL